MDKNEVLEKLIAEYRKIPRSGYFLKMDAGDDEEKLKELERREMLKKLKQLKKAKDFSEKNILYWPKCSFRVFKLTYEERLEKFLGYYVDSNEKDFIEKQFGIIDYYHGYPFQEINDFYQYSDVRKKEFLKGRLELFGSTKKLRCYFVY